MTDRTNIDVIDTQFAANWIASLRSGQYVQGQGKLHNSYSGAMCCLGVACNLNDPNIWEERRADRNEDYEYLSSSMALRLFGDPGRCEGPPVTINNELATLAIHNDGGSVITPFHYSDDTVTTHISEKTFAQIADALEEWYTELGIELPDPDLPPLPEKPPINLEPMTSVGNEDWHLDAQPDLVEL